MAIFPDFFISFIVSKLTEQEVLVQSAMGILYFLNPSIKQFMPGFFFRQIFLDILTYFLLNHFIWLSEVTLQILLCV